VSPLTPARSQRAQQAEEPGPRLALWVALSDSVTSAAAQQPEVRGGRAAVAGALRTARAAPAAPPRSPTPTPPVPRRQAVLAGLKALKLLGVWGVALDLHWADFEPAPRAYAWAPYAPALALARAAGLRVQANFNFHAAGPGGRLPGWVLDAGDALPDVFYTDRRGRRCRECLSLGVDDGARGARREVWAVRD
jgi:hypothetical protein